MVLDPKALLPPAPLMARMQLYTPLAGMHWV
jgi:hypothetical protein